MLHQRQEAQALPQNRSCGISLLLIPFLVLKPMSTGVTAEQNPQHVKAFNAFPVMLFMTCQQQGEVEYYIPRACTASALSIPSACAPYKSATSLHLYLHWLLTNLVARGFADCIQQVLLLLFFAFYTDRVTEFQPSLSVR